MAIRQLLVLPVPLVAYQFLLEPHQLLHVHNVVPAIFRLIQLHAHNAHQELVAQQLEPQATQHVNLVLLEHIHWVALQLVLLVPVERFRIKQVQLLPLHVNYVRVAHILQIMQVLNVLLVQQAPFHHKLAQHRLPHASCALLDITLLP